MAKVITARNVGNPDFILPLMKGLSVIRSDKDLHFTGALAKNASEQENLEGLKSDRITITQVNIRSEQNLHYQLLFFSKDGFTDSDLDVDSFIGAVDLNLPVYGKAVAV